MSQTHIPLANTVEINGTHVHRNQLVTKGGGGFTEDFVVVDLREDAVRLQDPAFEYPAFWVDEDDFDSYEAQTGWKGDPIFAY